MPNSVIVIGLPIALPTNDEVLSTIIGNLINSLQLNLRFDVEDAVVTTYDADSINNAILSDFINNNNRGKSRKKVREVTVDPILQAITFIGSLFENQLKNKQNITIALKIPSILSAGDEISVALKTEGVLYTSFKYGEFEGIRNGRYFIDLTDESFELLMTEIPSLWPVEIWITSDVRPGREDERWLNILLKKTAIHM